MKIHYPRRFKRPSASRPWSLEERAELAELWGTIPVNDIAEVLNRTPAGVEHIAREMGFEVVPAPAVCEHLMTSAQEQDAKFQAAMVAAIRAGKEKPPGFGVDKRPCTKNPIFIDHLRLGVIESFGSSMLAEIIDG